MSIVYFVSESGEIVGLDCEQSLTVSKANTVSQTTKISGSTVDGYTEGNKIVSLSGLVTYNKSAAQQTAGTPNPIEFQDTLDDFSKNHTRFRLYTDQSNLPLLRGIDNCMIQSYSIDLSSSFTDTIRVNLIISGTTISKGQRELEDKQGIPEDPKAIGLVTKGSSGKTTISDKEAISVFTTFKKYNRF